jgi:UDP-N-acetylglucosamine acyltransferase
MPQDKKYGGEDTRLEIGDDNVIREFVTISRGTKQDADVTIIGNGNLLMAYCHVAHDCVVGNHTVFSNSTSLAGHVVVEDYVVFGGFTLVHQFCKIGTHSFSAMNSVISKDVPPFIRVSGHMAKPFGLNAVGLERSGFDAQTLSVLRQAYKILYRSGLTLDKAIKKLDETAGDSREIKQLIKFLKTSNRGIIR